MIKTLEFDKQIYCDYINGKTNAAENALFNSKLLYSDYDLLKITKEDLAKNKITNVDLQFNQIDNKLFKK